MSVTLQCFFSNTSISCVLIIRDAMYITFRKMTVCLCACGASTGPFTVIWRDRSYDVRDQLERPAPVDQDLDSDLSLDRT